MPNCLLILTKTRLRVVVVILSCLAVVGLWSAVSPSGARVKSPQERASGKRTRAPYVPGEVLVRYRTEAVAKGRTGSSRLITREGLSLPIQVQRFDGSNLVPGLRLARVPAGDTMKAIAALKNQPEVLYAEPNYIMHAAVVPNDINFPQQYGLTKIGAPTAWNTNTGSNSVVVGVIDQGIDINHEDLAANIWTNPAPGSVSPVPGDPNPPITGDIHGYNFVDNNGTVFSDSATEDHATHVAGIIGAVGNNGKGVSGVNWSVSLMSLKFLAENGGDTADAIRACNYAKQMRQLWETAPVHTKGANIRVLNASFGGGPFSQAFFDSISELNDAGILFVAAAGNVEDGSREPNNDLVPQYPASFNLPNIIAVAATDSSDQVPSSQEFTSHFGATTVDLGAPGAGILSTVPGVTKYRSFDGTSMATPHVAGAAALLWAQNPNLTVAQVKDLLLLNGDIQAALVDKTLYGRRLNVANSFQSLAEVDTVAPGTVGGLNINSQTGRSINLGWTASGDNGASGQASLYQINFTDGGSGAVIPLRGVMPASSGSVQAATVKIPFRRTTGTLSVRSFDNVGNEGTPATLPVNVPLAVADPYVPSVGSAAGLSTGGARLNLNADDVYSDYTFPPGFVFPFFGENFTGLKISSNGALYFSQPPVRDSGNADDVPSSPAALNGYKMIAGLWDDLDLRNSRRTDSGVYLIESANRVIFRWQGVPCNTDFDTGLCLGGEPVNFEVELNSDGTIKTRYGDGNVNLLPTVGISGGEPDGYVITSHSSQETLINLTGAAEVSFTPRASTPTPTPTPTLTPTPTPTPTPPPSSGLQLILEESGPAITQVAALDAMLQLRDLFPVINSSNLLNTGFDQNTRVVIFVGNLQLLPGEQASAVTINLIDSNGQTHDIPAEDVRPVESLGFAQLIFRLPNNLPVGTCTIKVLAHNEMSNSGTIRIRN